MLAQRRHMGENRPATLCGLRLDGSAHVCAFFGSPDQKYDALVPFFREGLRQGDRILNVVDDAAVDDHLRTLREEGIPADTESAPDHVHVNPASEAYFQAGHFDPQAMLDMVRARLEESNAEGAALRTYGDMSWVSDPGVSPERVMEYEARVNEFPPAYDCTLVCGYDLGRVTGAVLSDIIATHPFVILNGEIRENPWYVEPKTYLDELLHGFDAGEEGPADLRPRAPEAAVTSTRPEGLEPPTT